MGLLRLMILSSVITTPDTDPRINTASVYELIERSVSFARGVRAVPRAQLSTARVEERTRNCGANLDCIAGVLDAAQIDRGLLVVVNLTVKPSLISLRLLDTRSKRVLATGINSCQQDSCDLERVLRMEVGAILQSAGHAIDGRLIIERAPAEAQVELVPDHGARQLRPGTYSLPPGTYSVLASMDNYVSTATVTTIFRQRETELVVRLEPDPKLSDSSLFLGVALGAALTAAGVVALVFWPSPKTRVLFCPGVPEDRCDAP